MSQKDRKPPQASDAASPEYAAKFWRAVTDAQGVSVLLPSGVSVRLRQYPLHEMIAQQRVPKRLQAAALRVYNEGAGALDITAAADNIAFLDVVICYSVVAPSVCDGQAPVADGAVLVHQIPVRDRLFIFAWAMGGVRASQDLVPF